MDKWIVPITVGFIAAVATVIATYLSAAKDRRDQRTNIARDLELIEKLPPESEARRLLAIYIEERALLLPTEEQVRRPTGVSSTRS